MSRLQVLVKLAKSLCELSVKDDSFEARVAEYVSAVEAYLSEGVVLGGEGELLEVHAEVIERMSSLKHLVLEDVGRLRRSKASLIQYLRNQGTTDS